MDHKAQRPSARRAALLSVAMLALTLAACQGGLDSGMGGMGGMGGDMGPPVQNPGPGQLGGDMGSPGGMPGTGPGAMGGTEPGEMAGPTMAPNGLPELVRPGATLAPNEAQYPVAQAPNGMSCPRMQAQLAQFGCSISFNLPTSSPAPSGSASPPASHAPSPKPSATTAADSPTPSPSPTPPGNMTLQFEPLPRDVPNMTRPDMRALRITPLAALRLQSDTPVALHGNAVVTFNIPRFQFGDGSFALQLYNEGFVAGRRTDQFVASYATFTTNGSSIRFAFTSPSVTVKQGQVWLLALYGIQYPPGTTPSPSPSAGASGSPSPSPSSSPAPSPTPSAKPT
jgi:hypothetical protein